MPSAEPAPAKAGDLVRLPQLAVLALERLDALALVRRWTRPHALVRLGLPHPVTQCLARAADLLGNRADRCPLRGVLALVVQDHPNRAGTDLGGIRGNSLRHGSILSRVGGSGEPGAVHNPLTGPTEIRGRQRETQRLPIYRRFSGRRLL